MIKESSLQTIQAITTTDRIRTVTSAGESRNVLVSDLSRTVIENYQAEMAGEVQSIAGAINSVYNIANTAAADIEIDSEVIDLYEDLGWTEATRSLSKGSRNFDYVDPTIVSEEESK